jgi:DNA-binding transcriptional regulator GbsR (MarR family)
MTDAEARFVEALEQHLVRRGMSPMPARVWAWLLVCDPAEQTAEELATELHASRGSISGAVRDLERLRIVRRARRRGERRERFFIQTGSVRQLIAAMEGILREGREIADEGLASLTSRPQESRARLQEFRDVYAYYEHEWPAVVERYLQSRERRLLTAVPPPDAPTPEADAGSAASA